MLSRRGLITGLVSLVAAPAIVRGASLMPVKVMEPTPVWIDSPIYSGTDINVLLQAQQRLNRWKSAMLSRDGHTYFIDGDSNVHCYDGAADEAFFAGEQWTPQQIDGLKAARIS